jgi:oxygen-independent coproporphyrinogen-3 oxidase
MCHNSLSFDAIRDQYNIDFFDYFYPEMRQMSAMSLDGLVKLETSKMQVTDVGQLLLRNIAMVFDAYIDPSESVHQYSKVI